MVNSAAYINHLRSLSLIHSQFYLFT